MRILIASAIVAIAGSAHADFSPAFYESIALVIRNADFVCDRADKIIGPTQTPNGRELSVHCGSFRYVVTITPSNRFFVRVR